MSAGDVQNRDMAMYAMSTIGRMREFSPNEDFEIWYEQFEEYIAANGIPEERTVSLFLTLVGMEGYKLLRNLWAPEKPKSKILEELFILIRRHLSPTPNAITERFKFKKRKQQQDESISTFLASIKQLFLYCEFGDTSLRDQLVSSLNNKRIQRKLLAETQLMLEKAVQLSLA